MYHFYDVMSSNPVIMRQWLKAKRYIQLGIQNAG
jgi:hypothetical protein